MGTASPSWQTMYADEKFSWFWPPAYDPASESSEVDAILSLLKPQPGARILDVACGRGWLTIPLAQREFQVTGLDLSEALLGRAKRAAEEAELAVEWVQGDMRHLPEAWMERFDVVTFTLSEFGCFSRGADNQRVLEEAARVLKPGGRYLLDVVVNRDGLVQQGETISYLEGDGFYVVELGSLDILSGIHKREFRWYQEGQRHETHWQIQTYTPTEVNRMLQQAGFQVLGAYSNFAGDELSRDSEGMVFLSQKNSM